MIIKRRVEITKRLKYSQFWEKLLNKWIKLINKMDEELGSNDVPYWYGERALTGLLASAAWGLSGGWSLEEFIAKRRTKNKNGRGDLWLADNTAKVTMEAKVVYPKRDVNSAIIKIENALDKASQQLMKLDSEYRVGVPFSVCYVVPNPLEKVYLEQGKSDESLLDLIYDHFVIMSVAIAIYDTSDKQIKDDGRIYPGIVLIARNEKIWV